MVNKKYAGFTMLECLVALVVLSCMCQLFQLMIQQSFIGNQYLKNNDSKSWHIFLIQLEKECQKLVFQTGSAQEISFLDSETNKTISIQIKEDKIIKRVNGKGYQPLLIGIKNGQFKNEGQSFTLKVTFTSGKTFDSFFPIKGEF
ncbi:TPA: ComGF family competence protein [Enterococcus faecalis]|uniref:competence type IV pilus minor pilin ComGF n=1 Tax=Enterococcus faecalis TaxID=1351 RepID=UPI0011596FED|nr:competence type IV pilus minor pilin ComGF [Enterococcus faecalis]EJH6408013.1 ComGF family competence protein [Enterococcus faecalis]HEG4562694.1 ComGF family competence protein [Enterococcus faecalis]